MLPTTVKTFNCNVIKFHCEFASLFHLHTCELWQIDRCEWSINGIYTFIFIMKHFNSP